MKFKQFDNGSCDIEFSWKERFILFKKGKLHFSDSDFKHFSTNLFKMLVMWQSKFNDDIKNQVTFDDTKINGK